jgi:eukaryotic-like serine/threonine-protein kinase
MRPDKCAPIISGHFQGNKKVSLPPQFRGTDIYYQKKCTTMKTLLFLLTLSMSIFMAHGNDPVVWKYKTDRAVIAAPMVRNDTVFIGSLDGNMYALNATSGQLLWQFGTHHQIRNSAVLLDNIVCFESGNVLYGLSNGGALLWTDTLYHGKLINEHDEWDVFRPSPIIDNGIAYIGSEEGFVIGVKIETGERVFQVQTPQANANIETTPAIYRGKIYVGDWLGVLSTFDLETRELLWQYDTKADNTYTHWVNALISQPLIHNDILYFGGRSCNLYALDPETGKKLSMYHQPSNMWIFGGPVEADNILYAGSSYQQVLYAFSPEKLELLWQIKVHGINYGDPLAIDKYVVVGTGDYNSRNSGSVTIVNTETKTIDGRINVGGWVQTPVFNNGKIFFGCADGHIYAVSMQGLLEKEWPKITLEAPGTIDLGQVEAKGEIQATFNILNSGGTDSISITAPSSIISFTPSNFILNPKSSQQITASINVEGINCGKKGIIAYINSNQSMFPFIISQEIRFEVIEITTGILHIPDRERFVNIYPNPVASNTTITMEYYIASPGIVELLLFDLMGREIQCLPAQFLCEGNHSAELNLSGIKKGIYQLRLISSGSMVSTQKIMIL